jgi:aspartate carbamoyltransferase catalytic subunit
MSADVVTVLTDRGVRIERTDSLAAVAPSIDVLYQTRIQKERFEDPSEFARARGATRVDAAIMEQLRPAAIVMHPLPRVDEIDPVVDADPRAVYFRQARNGVAVRMALLEMLVG